MEPFKVFPLYDINIVRGNACRIYDDQGTEYLDLYGGHAVISVGHTHPYFVQKVTEQLNTLGFYSNSVINSLQWELAKKLGQQSGYEDYSLFLVNSGAEANENAIKLASFYNGRRKIVSISKAFHGRTDAAVRVTDNPKIVAPVNEAIPVEFIPLNDIEAMERVLAPKDVCAIIIEGIQGVGGVNIPSSEFLQAVREMCDKTKTVLILDEIQSGYGRSGKFFAHQYSGIRPDLISVAKGIANGIPMGGLLISPKFPAVFGQLGTTFGGNQLACAGAIAVLDIMKAEKLVDNADKIGSYLQQELSKMIGKYEINDVRGRGLMIGIEFNYPVKALREKLITEQHVFTGASGTNILRILPPLCLTKTDVDLFLQRFKSLFVEK
ncbi:MAG: aminotransferase class III-fold pyridoxal phosphate-dependent enzyme [Paludibacteraceae bacterium]|jgi:acetylornithine aminotransferase|nr:aminotransferase class III-fold pyridoxal phosphate-dependent enzyme [Paludibacteraceae bacterium]